MGFDDIELEKSHMALLAGFGLFAIFGFFYFFMREKSGTIYLLAIITIILSTLMMFFLLLDKTKFAPAFITDANSNLIAGMFLFSVIFLVIISFTEITTDPFDGLRILILTALTATTIFLLMTSLLLDE